MSSIDKVRIILLEEFIKAQARNPRYSMRTYAKKVGIAQSAVSEILAGKRSITKKTANKILRGLDKDPNEISTLLENAEHDEPQQFKSLDIDSFHLIADWHYFAILSLAETKDFQSTDKWIARRLGIGEKLVSESIERLLRLDLIVRDKNTGKIKTTGEQLEAISAVASAALKKANRQNLELALGAIDEVPVPERDFTAITLCFDPDRMEDARKLLKNFRRNFSRVMEAGRKKEVYKLSIQLFPLSKRGIE